MSSLSPLDEALTTLDGLHTAIDFLVDRLLDDKPLPETLSCMVSALSKKALDIGGKVKEGRGLLQNELKSLQDYVEKCQAEREQEKDRSERTIANLNEEIARIEKEKEQIRKESDILENRRKAMLNSLYTKQAECEQAQKSKNQLSQTLQDAEIQLNESQATCRKLQAEIKNVRASNQELDQKLDTQHNNLVQSHKDQQSQLQRQIGKLESERDQLHRTLEIEDRRQSETIRREEIVWLTKMRNCLEEQRESHAKDLDTAVKDTVAMMQRKHETLVKNMKKVTVDKATADARQAEKDNIRQMEKNAADDLHALRSTKDNTIHSLEDMLNTKENEVKMLELSLVNKENILQDLRASDAKSSETIHELQSSNTAKDSAIEVMRISSTTKDGTIEMLNTSLAVKKDEIIELQTEHSAAIAQMKETHSMQMSTLWDQIRQLRSGHYVSSIEKTLAKDDEFELPSNEGRKRTICTTSTTPANVEVIALDSDGLYDGVDETPDAQHRDQSPIALSKRPSSTESESRLTKKQRALSPDGRPSPTSGPLDRSLSVISTENNPQDHEQPVAASDEAFMLWKLFICAWDVSTVEMQLLLRQFDGLFNKRSFEDIVQRIETHVVGTFCSRPPYPRPCLLADLRNQSHGNGGSTVARSCPYCKSDKNRICVWASYVPGVQSAFGNRVGGRIPKDDRRYDPNVTPWTSQIGAVTGRWVLHKRRMGSSQAIVNAWAVEGVQITFDTDPLAG